MQGSWQHTSIVQSKCTRTLGNSQLDVILWNNNTKGPEWNTLAMHSKHLIPEPSLQGRYFHHPVQRVNNTKAAKLLPGGRVAAGQQSKAALDWHKTQPNGVPFIYPTEEGPGAAPLPCLPGPIRSAVELSPLSPYPQHAFLFQASWLLAAARLLTSVLPNLGFLPACLSSLPTDASLRNSLQASSLHPPGPG